MSCYGPAALQHEIYVWQHIKRSLTPLLLLATSRHHRDMTLHAASDIKL